MQILLSGNRNRQNHIICKSDAIWRNRLKLVGHEILDPSMTNKPIKVTTILPKSGAYMGIITWFMVICIVIYTIFLVVMDRDNSTPELQLIIINQYQIAKNYDNITDYVKYGVNEKKIKTKIFHSKISKTI